jgi:nucleotide-binding universal stress UspA family protein
MEHIVVGFDGTRASFVALDWAAERAAREPCRVEIVTVDAARTLPGGIGEVAFRDAERRVMDRSPYSTVTSRDLPGHMPDALLRTAETADLLVIGTQRPRGARSTWSGRLPMRTVARSRVPTVVVPEDWRPTEGSIVVGVDDDESSSAAVNFAAAEADAAGAEVTLVHAWQLPPPTIEGSIALLESPIEVQAVHRRLLDRTLRHIADGYPTIRPAKLLVRDTPSAALLAASARASVLVLGTRHRGPVTGTLLGSVGRDALRLSRVPVCVVPMVLSAV